MKVVLEENYLRNLLKVKILNYIYYIRHDHKLISWNVFNRTVHDMIFKRLEADEKKGKENLQWVDYLPEVILTYNNKMKHSATGLTPNEARKDKNKFRAKLNIASKARKDRIYPEIEVDDKVKIIRKKRTGEKERTSIFLQGEYTVESISEKMGQKYYTITFFNRPLLRHEIVKV